MKHNKKHRLTNDLKSNAPKAAVEINSTLIIASRVLSSIKNEKSSSELIFPTKMLEYITDSWVYTKDAYAEEGISEKKNLLKKAIFTLEKYGLYLEICFKHNLIAPQRMSRLTLDFISIKKQLTSWQKSLNSKQT